MGAFRKGIIHVHSPFVYGALIPFLRFARSKSIVHVHLDYTEDELRWALRVSPDLILVCAQFMKPTIEKVLEARAFPTKVAVIQNAVDTDRFAPRDRHQAKRSKGIDPARTVLLMTANLAPHKGQDTAIRALAVMNERGYRPLLWLLGEERDEKGVYTRYLKTLATDLGVIGSVQFLGFSRNVSHLLNVADCLLLPSSREGLPLAVLEAQASKVPVLAAPTAGIPEVISDGETGMLIDADDFTGYAEALISLMDRPQLARTMAEAAFRQVTSRFTLTHYCERVAEHYQSILPPT